MKKLPVLFSLMLMAALLLAACGGANNNTNNVDDLTTPGVDDTLGTEMVPETGGDLDETPTLAVTDEVTLEPTLEPTATEMMAEATPTLDTAAGTDQTPVAGGEVGGECRPFQLTSYLDYEIAGADGENIGEVDGLVVYRDAELAGDAAAAGAGMDAGAGTDAGADAAQATPATDVTPVDGDMMGPDFSTFTPGQYANPQIAYFVVDFDDAAGYGDGETLIPFNAFTPLNEQTAFEDCLLVFASSYELSDFPVWDWDARPDVYEEDWDNEWRGFWSNLGVDVNTTATGGQQLGNPVVFRDNFDDINVLNLNNEDLGEIEEFIIDPETGEMRYAVLAAGGFLGIGEKLIPIPMEQLIWGNYDDDYEDIGEIYINHPDDGWENAPEIEDLDNVDFAVDTWADEFDLYWEGLNGGTTTP